MPVAERLGRRPKSPPVTPRTSQQPERYPPLDFTPHPWRRTSTALLISGPVLLAALMVADVLLGPYKSGAEVDGAGESTESTDWYDLVFVVTLTLGLGAAFAGLVLFTLSLISRTPSRTRRRK